MPFHNQRSERGFDQAHMRHGTQTAECYELAGCDVQIQKLDLHTSWQQPRLAVLKRENENVLVCFFFSAIKIRFHSQKKPSILTL